MSIFSTVQEEQAEKDEEGKKKCTYIIKDCVSVVRVNVVYIALLQRKRKIIIYIVMQISKMKRTGERLYTDTNICIHVYRHFNYSCV